MKKTVIGLFTAAALLLAGCGSQKTIDAAALAKSLATEIEYDDTLQEVDADTIAVYFDLPDGVDAVMYMGSGSTAEEVAVFTAPDTDTAKTVLEAVQAHLDDQTASYEDYLPDEANRIGNAMIEQKNQYVALCVSGDRDKAKEIFEEAFE